MSKTNDKEFQETLQHSIKTPPSEPNDEKRPHDSECPTIERDYVVHRDGSLSWGKWRIIAGA